MFPFFPTLPRLQPGQAVPSADQWNALVEAVERFSRIGTTGSVEVVRAGNELNLHVREREVWDARITGTAAGPVYAWQEVLRQSATWINGPRSGTTSSLPGRELTDNPNVTTDGTVIVEMWYAQDGASTEFASIGSSSCATCLSQLCVIKDANGYITEIRFKDATGNMTIVPECPSVGPPPGPAPSACCSKGTAPKQVTFSLSNIANAAGGICQQCFNFNRKFLLTLGQLDPQYFPCCYSEIGAGASCADARIGTSIVRSNYNTPDDGMLLRIGTPGLFCGNWTSTEPVALAYYFCPIAQFDCLGSNVFTLRFATPVGCAGWPQTITVTPV